MKTQTTANRYTAVSTKVVQKSVKAYATMLIEVVWEIPKNRQVLKSHDFAVTQFSAQSHDLTTRHKNFTINRVTS